jgi:spore maturation protein CgeB
MRVLVVDTYYPAFLAAHYDERPALAQQPYAEQLESLIARGFGTSDAYSHYLRGLGHDAQDVIVNCEQLQLRWAEEHGLKRAVAAAHAAALPGRAGLAARRAALHIVARAQIDDYRPDVLYLQDLWFFTRGELDAFRQRGMFVAGQIASPAPGPGLLRGFDLILTSFPHFVERFRALGVASEYLKIAFDHRVIDRLAERGIDAAVEAERPQPVTFVGGLNPRVHGRGTALLERVCNEVEVAVYGYGIDELDPASPIRERWRGEAWGLDMYEVLARSQIVLNRHIDAAEGHANNMRLYEATGIGAMLLTDPGINLSELFEPEHEVSVYEDGDDLVARLKRYGQDHERRLAIAAAGHARTLREHTYERRITELAAMLEARL